MTPSKRSLALSPRRALAAGVALTVFGGCVTEPQPDIPQDAILTYETVRFEAPDGSTSADDADPATGFATLGQPLVGEASQVRALTLATVGGTNALLFGTLFGIDLVTRFPPSLRHDDLWLWQGRDDDGAGDAVSRFTLTAHGPGAAGERFGYLLEKRFATESDAALRAVFDGTFEAARDEADFDDARVRAGQGVVRYDFDAMRVFDPDGARGQMSVALRSRGGVRQVRVWMRDVQGADDPQPTRAIYEYVQRRDRSGEYAFSTRVDWMRDGEPLEDLAVRVVWDVSGAGRALGAVTGGSTATSGVERIEFQECWAAGDGLTVWTDTTPDLPALEGGAETDCAASLQGLVLEPPPTGLPPDTGDPQLPAPHPDEAL